MTQEWQVVLNKTRDLGRNGAPKTAPELASIIACYAEITGRDSGDEAFRQPEAAQLITQAAGFLGQCKQAARTIKLARPTRAFWLIDASLPPRTTADAMANLYFEAFESTHRVLDIPMFWTDYGVFWDQPDSASPAVRHTVLLVLSIGSSLSTHVDTEMVHQCIYAAEAWLAGPLEKDRVSIAGLQVHCLSLLARQIFSIGDDTTWISTGSIVNAAMQLGLHRDPGHLPTMPRREAEIWRCLWATILELTVQAALDARMSPRISFDEFDMKPPGNNEIDQSATVQICLNESLPVRSRIAQALGSLHKITYDEALDLSAQLIEAIRKSNRRMKKVEGVTLFHKNMVDYLVRRFMIPLHYSFCHQMRQNKQFYYSLKLSFDSAIAMIHPEGLDGHFSRLMTLGGGLFRQGIRSAQSAMVLRLLVQAHEQHLDGMLGRNTDLDAVKKAVEKMIVLADERIRLGETNVKSHMFLRMALAEVTALEAGLPVQVEVTRAARDSLEFCLGLLGNARAGDVGAGLELDWESLMSDVDFL